MVTIQQLLTHTSGLEPSSALWRNQPDPTTRINAVLEAEPQTASTSHYSYSDLNFITLGVLTERCSGSGLDTVLARQIIDPLGMTDTGFNPPGSMLPRIAATEYQSDPPRGMIRGQVHDENAYSLDGVAGHAGMFSTARDTAVLGQALLNGGSYAGTRILRPDTVRTMFTNHTPHVPGPAQGLGLELDRPQYMGALSASGTAGHSGYTGTSMVIDPLSNSLAILLTNRVHPSRSRGSINSARRMWASSLTQALKGKHHPRPLRSTGQDA